MHTEQVPANACYFSAGEVVMELDGDPLSTRVSLLARSATPIDHWHWGRVVHDLAGVKAKDKIPIDYAHNSNEVIGFLDTIEVEERGLRTDGRLVVFSDDDRAAEVAYKSAQGVPYEASINFGGDGIQLEEVKRGESTDVNGYQFEGPGVVVRSWPLRGVAVVPYGADSQTETNILHEGGGEIAVEFLTRKETDMPARKKKASKKPEIGDKLEAAVVEETVEQVDQVEAIEEPATDDQAAVEEIIAETVDQAKDKPADDAKDEKPADEKDDVKLEPKFSQSEGQKFVREFGDIGAVWFVEGITFEEGQQRQLSQLQTELAALRDENEQLRQRVSAVEICEADGVEFSAAPQNEETANSQLFNDYQSKLPTAAAAFATRFEVARNNNGR